MSQYCNVRNIVAHIGQKRSKTPRFCTKSVWNLTLLQNQQPDHNKNAPTESVDQHQDASHSKIRDHIQHASNI